MIGQKIDWIGTLLLTGALLPLLMGLTWLNSPYPPSDPHVVAPIVIGCVFTVAFGLFGKRFDPQSTPRSLTKPFVQNGKVVTTVFFSEWLPFCRQSKAHVR